MSDTQQTAKSAGAAIDAIAHLPISIVITAPKKQRDGEDSFQAVERALRFYGIEANMAEVGVPERKARSAHLPGDGR